MSRELTQVDEGCEICGAKPAWDFPWCGVFCAKCAGPDEPETEPLPAKPLPGWLEKLRNAAGRWTF
jgi:hypothetical protein